MQRSLLIKIDVKIKLKEKSNHNFELCCWKVLLANDGVRVTVKDSNKFEFSNFISNEKQRNMNLPMKILNVFESF